MNERNQTKKLNDTQLAKLSVESVRLEGLPVPDGLEEMIEAYNKGLVSREEIFKTFGV